MFKRVILTAILIVLFSGLNLRSSVACESCTITRIGREQGAVHQKSRNKKWFFKYLFEYQNWDKMDARDAHELHHSGHHFHDKTSEDLHHFTFGGHVTDALTVSAEIPYVIRRSLEVDDHTILSSKQRSEGLGDLHLIGDHKVWEQGRQSASFVAGLKFPTGETKERNSAGTRFEPELQPGTGSFDYILGGVYKREGERFTHLVNTAYVFKTEGAQDFEFGDALSTSLFVDYLLNPQSALLPTRLGIDANLQYAWKQKDHGTKVADSGGTTLLLGPAISVGSHEGLSVFTSIMFPAYQHLNGVHQELDYTWTAGGKVNW